MFKTLSTITNNFDLEIYTSDEAGHSPYAKFYRMGAVEHFVEETKKKEEGMVSTLVNQFAELSRYDFFKKRLWKKVKGFKNWDEAEIVIAFATARLKNLGIYTRPCGIGWSSFVDWTKEGVEEYLKDYQPVFEAYSKWCMSQR